MAKEKKCDLKKVWPSALQNPEADESWFREADLPRRLLPRGEPFKVLFDALDL